MPRCINCSYEPVSERAAVCPSCGEPDPLTLKSGSQIRDAETLDAAIAQTDDPEAREKLLRIRDEMRELERNIEERKARIEELQKPAHVRRQEEYLQSVAGRKPATGVFGFIVAIIGIIVVWYVVTHCVGLKCF
jgi:hypothetical protein